MKPPKQIEILPLDPHNTGGALRVLADLRVGQLTLRPVCLIEDPVGGYAMTDLQQVRQTDDCARQIMPVVCSKYGHVAIPAAYRHASQTANERIPEAV